MATNGKVGKVGISPADLRAIQKARGVLHGIRHDARDHDSKQAYQVGMFHEAVSAADDALFNVLNIGKSHLHLDLGDILERG